MMKMKNNNYELIKFEDGDFSLDVNVSPNEDTVWLNRIELSLLFDRDIKTIGKHIKNILKEEYSNIEGVIAKIATTANDGKTYMVEYYNLDMILSIGYLVKSKRGIMFRRWANSILKQYLLNGQVINKEISLFQANHNLTVIRTNKYHDRFTIKDNELYSIGSSIKDIGKKISTISKLENVDISELLK